MTRRALPLPFLLAITIALLTGGCGSIFSNAPEDARSIVDGDAMRLQLSSTTVTEGQPLSLTVTLTNAGTSPITYEENTCPHSVYEVEDANGTRIDPRIELILCAAYTRRVQLLPGESTTWPLIWNAARYAPSESNRAAGQQTVRIRARYWVNDGQLVSSAWQSVVVRPAD